MDPETKQLVEQVQKSLSDLQQKYDQVVARDPKIFARLGLDANGEDKHNLTEMAGKVADLELAIQKMRRARVLGELTPTFDDAPVGSAKRKSVFYQSEKERAQHIVRDSDEYRRAMNNALRNSGDGWAGVSEKDRAILQFKSIPESVADRIAPEVKDGLSTDFQPGAGFLAPPTMESEIDRIVLESSPLGELARVVNIGSGSYEGLIRNANRDTISQRSEREGGRTSSTQLKRYDQRRIEVFESEATPALTQTQLEDSIIDLAQELQNDASEDFAIDEARKLISGTGVGEAEGLMTSSELKQLASGSASTFTMANIRQLPQELKVPYKNGATYLLSRGALTTLLLFRNDSGAGANTGDFMWQPSLLDGTPSRLNGYGWREAVDMDAVGAGTFPIVFGNFQRAYRIVRRRGIRILRDELTEKPYVVFHMTKRFGGKVWIGEAAVKLKCATSL